MAFAPRLCLFHSNQEISVLKGTRYIAISIAKSMSFKFLIFKNMVYPKVSIILNITSRLCLVENYLCQTHKCFHGIRWIQLQKYLSLKGLGPATSCVRDQDATTVSARHIWTPRSLNWTQFMLEWFTRFPEFAEFSEFNESSAPLREKSIDTCYNCLQKNVNDSASRKGTNLIHTRSDTISGVT